MFAKILGGQVIKYPYTFGDLLQDNPHTSFPPDPPPDLLAEFDVFTVAPLDAPVVGYEFNVSEAAPQMVNGVWTQQWLITPAAPEELAQRTETASASVRSARNAKLLESDWTDTASALQRLGQVRQQAWATYRQALRDVTTQEGFPWTVTWPVEPGKE